MKRDYQRLSRPGVWAGALLLVVMLTAVCQQKPGGEISLYPKKSILTLNVENKLLSGVLAKLQEQEGIRIEVWDFKDKTVSIKKSGPIMETLTHLLGKKTKFRIVVERGELVITANSGPKKGRKEIQKKDLPGKQPAEKEMAPTAVKPVGNFKVRPDTVKLLESGGEKGTKAPVGKLADVPIAKGPKMEPGKPVTPKDVTERYARLRFRMEGDKVTLVHAVVLPGKYPAVKSTPDKFIYSVQVKDRVMAVGSFSDPLEQHTFFPEKDKPHEILRAKTGFFNVTLHEHLLTDEMLMNLKLSIFRVEEQPAAVRALSTESFQKYSGLLKPLLDVSGKELKTMFNTRAKGKKGGLK